MSDGTADRQLRERARAVIPGGMYGHQAAPGAAYPQFMRGGRGARVWDADGNEYVDLMCSYGPVVLGHGHPAVEAAARARHHRSAEDEKATGNAPSGAALPTASSTRPGPLAVTTPARQRCHLTFAGIGPWLRGAGPARRHLPAPPAFVPPPDRGTSPVADQPSRRRKHPLRPCRGGPAAAQRVQRGNPARSSATAWRWPRCGTSAACCGGSRRAPPASSPSRT